MLLYLMFKIGQSCNDAHCCVDYEGLGICNVVKQTSKHFVSITTSYCSSQIGKLADKWIMIVITLANHITLPSLNAQSQAKNILDLVMESNESNWLKSGNFYQFQIDSGCNQKIRLTTRQIRRYDYDFMRLIEDCYKSMCARSSAIICPSIHPLGKKIIQLYESKSMKVLGCPSIDLCSLLNLGCKNNNNNNFRLSINQSADLRSLGAKINKLD